MKKLLSLVLILIALSMATFSQVSDREKMTMEREAKLRVEATTHNLDQKVNPYGEPIQLQKIINNAGALTPRGKNEVNVLVASPDAADFNTHVLSTLQVFGGVTYTATSNLGALTVEQMLGYDVVMTFNVTKWDSNTGTTPIEWSNKLGDFITAGGYLVEAQFVNGFDAWALLGGNYITENMSPFTKATIDRPAENFVLGEIVTPYHPIMSGVNEVTTNYFVQNVNVRSDATLIAKWGNATADPLVAVYNNIVAFNADPLMSSGDVSSPGLGADGYKMLHNAIIWLFNNQADPLAPAAPTNLTAVAGANGALTATLSWNNPNETVNGNPLADLTKITVMVNDEQNPEHTINNPTIGAAENYTYTAVESGIYVFNVYASNTIGDGPVATTSLWIGNDTPAAPTNVVLTATAAGGKVTWDAPTEGINGGYINPANTTYTVIRMPDTVVAEDIAETEFADNFDPIIGNYQYKVIASNEIGQGGSALSNVLLLGAGGKLFYETFDNSTIGGLPAGWSKEGVETASWTVQDSDIAGGTAPEMKLDWSPAFNGLSRLVTNSFSPGSNENLVLNFKHYLSNFSAAGQTLAVQASFDGGDWVDLWRIELTTSFGPEGKEIYFTVPTGTSQMRLGWEFEGNVFNINNYNFDDLIVEPVVSNDLAAISITGSPVPTVGEPETYTVTIQNSGIATQTGYTVKLMKEGGVELASATGVEIGFTETKTFDLVWTPEAADAGAVNIYGGVVLANDEVDSNNKTGFYKLTVQPQGVIPVTIGSGTNYPPTRLPFDFYWRNSFVQTIYYADEINLGGGAITSLAYTNNFTLNLSNKAIKVWVAETDANSMQNGWIPFDEFTLVYDGTMNFPDGENTIVIPFETPYIYNGGNLVVYTNRVWEEAYATQNDRFYGSEDPGSQRTRYFYADGFGPLEPENPGDGYLNDWHPNTTFFFNTQGLAEITGSVIDTETQEPIKGVAVETNNAKAKTYTDEDGEFYFMLMPGTYNFSFNLFGYESKQVGGIELFADEHDLTTLQEVELTAIPQYMVNGTVKGNDGLFLQGATVKLEGYGNYETLTDANGNFTFPEVYLGTYTISININGYAGYVEEGILVDQDLTLSLIELVELIGIPGGLSVDIYNQEEGNALFTWGSTEVEYRYDDGTVDGELGFAEGTFNHVLGSVHRRKAILSSVSWFLTEADGPHETVKVWILGLKPTGTPDASNVLFSQDDVENIDMQWNTLELPEPVAAPNGFYIAIGGEDFISLATDTGEDLDWPFQANTHFAGNMETGVFFTFEDQNYPVNPLIRATGYDQGELRFDTYAEETSSQAQGVEFIKREKSFNSGILSYNSSVIPSSRAFLGFNVYLDDLTTPVVTQTQEEEHLFTGLAEGNYTAGVQSVYTTGSSEIITINFMMDYGVFVSVNVATNSGDSPEGALVTLVGANHTHSGTVNAEGHIEFPLVYKGTYNLTVSLGNHEEYKLQNINIQEDKVFDVLLAEIMSVPYGLMVEQLNDNIDVKFSWNNFFGFTDDFESYEDFIIENIGEYTLYDGDGSETYGFSGLDFPNSEYVGSYIIFNPSQTNPPMDTDEMEAHSGDKIIACFAAYDGPNNDWLISPQLKAKNGMTFSFWAQTFMDYGLEEFRIAVSTTDTNPASFTFITNKIQVPLAWTKYEYDLSAYADQNIYVAIVCVSDDVFVFMVDDLSVNLDSKMGDNVLGYTQTTYAHSNVPNASKALLGYKVYLDGQLVSGDSPISAEQFVFENLKGQATYSAGVKSVYSSGESEMQSLIFTTGGTSVLGNPLSTITAYPNPFDNRVTITNAELVKRVIVTNALGQRVMDVQLNGNDFIYTQSLSKGVYLLLLEGENGQTTVRRMVKQ